MKFGLPSPWDVVGAWRKYPRPSEISGSFFASWPTVRFGPISHLNLRQSESYRISEKTINISLLLSLKYVKAKMNDVRLCMDRHTFVERREETDILFIASGIIRDRLTRGSLKDTGRCTVRIWWCSSLKCSHKLCMECSRRRPSGSGCEKGWWFDLGQYHLN